MSEISNNIVSLIISKEFHKAKMLIHEAMNNKLGILLEEKLLEYAPTLYEGKDTEYSSAFGGKRYNDETERLNKEAYKKYEAKYDEEFGASETSEESPVAERVFKTGKDMTNVATTTWLANQTKVLDGVGRVLPVVKKLPIAPAIFPAIVAGEALMTSADIATNPDWKGNKLKAIGDAADDIAHKGVRLAAFSNPVTGIPSYFDQAYNDGRATDAVTDALIKGPSDKLDDMGILSDLSNPDAVKKYNNSLIGTIWPEHSVQHDADKMSADIKVKRDLRRRGVTQQDTEKPPVTAGTVRNGSGQIMQQ